MMTGDCNGYDTARRGRHIHVANQQTSAPAAVALAPQLVSGSERLYSGNVSSVGNAVTAVRSTPWRAGFAGFPVRPRNEH
jgi:hypothetical protein